MDTLGIWIGLNFLETVLFYYLLFGNVIDRKELKSSEKIILYFVLAGTVVIMSVWGRKSVFSTYGYLLTMLLLISGCFLACRKKLVLLAGIASMYQSAMRLLLYVIVYFLTFIYENQADNPQIFFFREHENEVFCVIRSLLLIIFFFIIRKIRNWKKKKDIEEFRWVFVLSGILLSALVLEYQRLLQYGLLYSTAGIPGMQEILKGSLVSFLTMVILVSVMLFLIWKNRSIKRENTFLLMKEEMEKQKYEEMNAAIEQNKELVHDTKNHFLVISEYVKNQEYEKLEKYVDEIRENFVKINPQIYTGNPVVDLILGQKRILAVKKGIEFQLDATPLSSLAMEEREICSLFGNLLDNALEACEQVTDKERRKIVVKIEQHMQMLFLEIQNGVDQIPVRSGQNFLTSKQDKSLHGYGLKSVERIVARYDGDWVYEVEDGMFVVSITFFDL